MAGVREGSGTADMKTLYLMRHAKSAHGGGFSGDHDRPLNQRGRDAALLVGDYMAAHGMTPEYVLCSDAERTRETLALLAPRLDAIGPVDTRSDLYLAGERTMLKAIQSVPGEPNSVLLIGHNPGLESLALALADSGAGDAAGYARLEQKCPTGALAILEFDTEHWRDVGPGRGRLLDFVVPRVLAAAD